MIGLRVRRDAGETEGFGMAGADRGNNWGSVAHRRQQPRSGQSSRGERRPGTNYSEPALPQIRHSCTNLWPRAEGPASPNVLEAQCGVELTPQKWRVLRLLAQGLSNREISQCLGMSRLVCKNHIAVILERTGMGTRLELALWYWQKCEGTVRTMATPRPADCFSATASH